MSYSLLSPTQRKITDAIFNCEIEGRDLQMGLAKLFDMKLQTVKAHLHQVYLKYGIAQKQWIPSVRLVYLRSKELRMW